MLPKMPENIFLKDIELTSLWQTIIKKTFNEFVNYSQYTYITSPETAEHTDDTNKIAFTYSKYCLLEREQKYKVKRKKKI